MPANTSPARGRENGAAASTAPVEMSGLGNRFLTLLGRKGSRRSVAAEVSQLLVDALRLKAAAVLGYDSRRDALALIADHGLSKEARGVLGNGADSPWDIPVRGMRNRRISVIEAAHQNPFVPRGLISLAPAGLCIASLPIYYDFDPIGVVLLFAGRSRAFSDAQLQTVSQALRVCGRGLRDTEAPRPRASALRREALPVEPPPAATIESRPIGAVVAQSDAGNDAGALARLRLVEGQAAPPVQPADSLLGDVQRLEQELARAHADRERATEAVRNLTSANRALKSERDQLTHQLEEIERGQQAEAAELRTQFAVAEERLLAADSERVRYQRAAEARHHAAVQSAQALQTQLASAQEHAQAAESSAAEAQGALVKARDEGERATARNEALTRRLSATQAELDQSLTHHAQERGALAADRDFWKQQASAAQGDLTQRAQELAAVERDLRAATVVREALAAQLQTSREELERLVALTEDMSRGATLAEASRANAVAEIATLQHHLEDARAAQALAQETLGAQVAAGQAEVQRLSALLQALRIERDQRTEAVTEREDQLARVRGEYEGARAAAESWQHTGAEQLTRIAELTTALDDSEGERLQLLAQRARFVDAEGELRNQVAALRDELERTGGELAQARDTVMQRNEELACVRQEHDTDRAAAERWQQTSAAQATEIAALASARAQSDAERQEALARYTDLTTAEHSLRTALERDAAELDALRAALTARDAAVARLQQEQQTLRAAAANGELSAAAQAAEIANFQAAFERAAEERRDLVDECARLTAVQTALRAESGDLRAALEGATNDAGALRAALTARDEQLTKLHEEHQSASAAAADWQRASTARGTEIADLQAALARGAAEQRELVDQHAAVTATAETLRSRLATLQADLDRAVAALDSGRDAVTAREVELADLGQELAGAREAATGWERKAAEHSNEVARLAAALQQAVNEREQLAAQHESLSAADQTLREALRTAQTGEERSAERVSLLQAEVAEREAQIERLHHERDAARHAVTAREQADAAQRAEIGRLMTAAERSEAEIQQLTTEYARLREAEQTLRERLATAEPETERLSSYAASLRDQLAERDRAVTAGAQQITQLVGEVRTLTTVRQALSDEHGVVVAADRELRTQLAAARGDVQQISGTLDSLRAQVAAREEVISERERHIGDLQAELKRQTRDHRKLADQRQTLQQTETYLRAQLAASAEETGRLTSEAAALRQALADLEGSLAARDQVVAELSARQEQSAAEQTRTLEAFAEAEERWRAEVAASVASTQREAAAAAALQAQLQEQQRLLAERDRQLADLRRAQDAAREAEHSLGGVTAQLRAEVAALTAQLSAAGDERQQWQDEREALLGGQQALHGRLAGADDAVQRLSLEASTLAGRVAAHEGTLAERDGELTRLRQEYEVTRAGWKKTLAQHDAEFADLRAQLERGAQERLQLQAEGARYQQVQETLTGELASLRGAAEGLGQQIAALRNEVAQREAQLERLRQEHTAGHSNAEALQGTVTALRDQVAQQERLLERGASERQQLHDAHAEAERQLQLLSKTRGRQERLFQELTAARQEIAQLQGERQDLRGALADVQQRMDHAAKAHTQAVNRLQSESADARRQLEAQNAEHAAAAARYEQGQRAHSEHLELESRHAATLAERCTTLEQALSAAEAKQAATGALLAEAHQQNARLREQTAERAALAQQVTEFTGRIAELEELTRVLGGQAAAVRDEHVRTEQRAAAIEAEVESVRRLWQETKAEAQDHKARLHEALQRLAVEQQHLEGERAQWLEEAAALRRQADQLAAAGEQTRGEHEETLARERELKSSLASMQQRLDELDSLLRERAVAIEDGAAERQQLEEAVRVAEAAAAASLLEGEELRHKVQHAVRRLKQERSQHAAEMQALVREAEAHAAVESREAGAEPSPPAVSAEDEARAGDDVLVTDEPLVIERSAPLASAVDAVEEPVEEGVGAPQPQRKSAPAGELVLLDEGPLGEDACAALQGAGFEVTALAASEAAVDQLARRKLKCVLLNLGAGPAAWRALRQLRERVATRSVPILAYIMTADAPTGFAFGPVDFALWPVEPSRLVERLEHLRPKLHRLLAVSADIDGMGRLRDPLVQANISTSIVLDGKQAVDFANMVQPEAAMLHLSTTCPSTPRAIAALRANESTRDLPLLLLLDKAAVGGEDAFFANSIRQLLGKGGAFQFSRLPEEIGRLIS